MTEYFITEKLVGQEGIQKALNCLRAAGVITNNTKYGVSYQNLANTNSSTRITDYTEQDIYLGIQRVFSRDDLVIRGTAIQRDNSFEQRDISFHAYTYVPYGKGGAALKCLK